MTRSINRMHWKQNILLIRSRNINTSLIGRYHKGSSRTRNHDRNNTKLRSQVKQARLPTKMAIALGLHIYYQAGIEWVLIENFSGVASGLWAFPTKFWLFLGGSIQWNTTKNFYKNSFNPSLFTIMHLVLLQWNYGHDF